MSNPLYSLFERAGGFLEQHARLAAAALLALVFLAALAQAAGKPFGNDEIYTLFAAALPNWRAVWNFYAQGADTPSPLPSLVVHAMLRFPSNPEIATRIPFILAFLVMCLCLYLFLRRRYPAGYALAALIAPVILPFFFHYSTENRAYAFLLAGAGFAAVCWQAAQQPGKGSRWNTFGLWLGLAFAICAHAFAIFLFVPFALAQLVADLQKKKLSLPIWLVLLLFPVGILPVIHGELAASHAFRGSFFSKPGWAMLQQTYRSFFADSYAVCATMLLFAIITLVMHRHAAAANPDASDRHGLTRAEIVFAVSLAIMPVWLLPAARLLGVYREPYSSPALFGIEFCVIAALAELSRRKIALGAILFTAVLFAVCAKTASLLHWRTLAHLQRVHTENVQAFNQQDWSRIVASSPLPIAMADTDLYMRSRYYWPESMQQRSWYLTDLAQANQYAHSTSAQISIIRSGKFVPLPSMDWAEFSARYPHFLLVQRLSRRGMAALLPR